MSSIILRDTQSGSDSGSDSAAGGGLPSFWWYNALDSFLFFLIAVGAMIRIFRHVGDRRTDVEEHAPSIRYRFSIPIFVVLALYGISRSVVEALGASNVIPGMGTFEWSLAASIASGFFLLLQVLMLAKWVHCAEVLVYEIRHTTMRLGAVVVTSSAALLGCFFFLTVFSAADVAFQLTSLTKLDWLEMMNLYQGTTYLFNGLCFLVLGLQLAFFWSSASEGTRTSRLRIMAISIILFMLLLARGVILCLFAFTFDHVKKLSSVMDSGWGSPSVLIVEWMCLVVALFVLQPDAQRVDNAASVSITSSSSNAPDTPRTAPLRFSAAGQHNRLDSHAIESLRHQIIHSARNDSITNTNHQKPLSMGPVRLYSSMAAVEGGEGDETSTNETKGESESM